MKESEKKLLEIIHHLRTGDPGVGDPAYVQGVKAAARDMADDLEKDLLPILQKDMEVSNSETALQKRLADGFSSKLMEAVAKTDRIVEHWTNFGQSACGFALEVGRELYNLEDELKNERKIVNQLHDRTIKLAKEAIDAEDKLEQMKDEIADRADREEALKRDRDAQEQRATAAEARERALRTAVKAHCPGRDCGTPDLCDCCEALLDADEAIAALTPPAAEAALETARCLHNPAPSGGHKFSTIHETDGRCIFCGALPTQPSAAGRKPTSAEIVERHVYVEEASIASPPVDLGRAANRNERLKALGYEDVPDWSKDPFVRPEAPQPKTPEHLRRVFEPGRVMRVSREEMDKLLDEDKPIKKDDWNPETD